MMQQTIPTVLKAPIQYGDRFLAQLPEGKKLYVNDNYQYGVEIEESMIH